MPFGTAKPDHLTAAASFRMLALAATLFQSVLPCFAAVDVAIATPRHSAASSNPLADSEKLVMQGRVDDAVLKLRGIVAGSPQNGNAHLLLCRAFYSEELPDEAVPECEAALVTLANDSKAQDWMGRAYGLKADRSGPIAGYKLATKVKTAFETAVELDPKNGDAVNDIGEYYVGAPSIVGGGVDKAFALADRAEGQLPQVAHRIRALAAEKQHDYDMAEREFKAAVATGGSSDAWTDLGHFYSRHGQKAQALDALQHALSVDKGHGPALVDVAAILIKMNTAPDIAQRALHDYLASNAKSDSAPAFKAYVELGQILDKGGDKQGAQAQFQSALALARDYPPAKKAIQHL
jgi:tetratricopeptide (TPR) repeat protein